MPASSRRAFYSIKAEAERRHADVYIYAEVGPTFYGDEVSANDLVRDIDGLDVDSIALRVNSPGGSVFDGSAIYNALKRHPAQVTTYVDGLAASIASVIALAGDRVVVAPNAMFMVHNPWIVTAGESSELRKTATMLDKLRDNLVAVYERKTGASREVIGAAMDAETWLDADEAVAFGLADEVADDAVDVAATARYGVHALDRFEHAPDRLVAALARSRRPGAELELETHETAAQGALTAETRAKLEAAVAALEQVLADGEGDQGNQGDTPAEDSAGTGATEPADTMPTNDGSARLLELFTTY